MLADLAWAIAGGAEVISGFRVIGDQGELFGLVASVPTAWRTQAEIAGGGEPALGKITAALNAARRRARPRSQPGTARCLVSGSRTRRWPE